MTSFVFKKGGKNITIFDITFEVSLTAKTLVKGDATANYLLKVDKLFKYFCSG